MTSDGDTLFRAICENPADDTPRLVYADWLEENGRPERAEFIRLQCEAREYCRAFPSLAAARTRASDLLRARRTEWEAELPTLAGVEWSSLWVRGFVDSAWVFGSREFVAAADRMFAAAPLRYLTLSGSTPGWLDRVLSVGLIRRLATLRFVGGELTWLDQQQLTAAERNLPGTQFDWGGAGLAVVRRPPPPRTIRRRR
jgi:uncharacterized protein (TIGR02996 family)